MQKFLTRRLTGGGRRLQARVSAIARTIRNDGVGELLKMVSLRALLRSAASFWSHRTRSRLQTILQNLRGRRPLIMVGTLDWAYPFQQRPHHLARALARQGITVIYVSPRYGRDRVLSVAEVYPGVYLTPHLHEALTAIPNPVVYVASTDVLALPHVLNEVQRTKGHIVYDYLDHIDGTISNAELSNSFWEAHDLVLRDETLASIVSSADILHEEVGRLRRKGYTLVTNAVDIRHFAARQDRMRLRPFLRAIVDRGAPIIGFFGALASWVNVELVAATARLRPSYQFVLMGPVLINAPAVLGQLPENVSIVEPVPYEELPSQAAFFDVLTIPFHLNEITAATSPLKLFEYMALGKPIVSTPINECLKYDVVLTAANPNDFAQSLDRALSLAKDEAYRARLGAIAGENSWDTKARDILRFIDSRA